MYVTVTTADTSGEPIENASIVAEELERWLRETDGFEGFLMLTGENKAVGLAFWASREVAERHTPRAPSSASGCSRLRACGSRRSSTTRSRSRASGPR